jgi:hypothetical protein
LGYLYLPPFGLYEEGPVEIFILLFAMLVWPVFVVALLIVEVGPIVSEFMNRKI